MYKILLLLVLCFPVVTHAGYWVGVDIKDIRAFTDQQAHYIAVNNFTNPEGCSVNGTIVLYREDTNNWKMVHSLMISGFVSGLKLQVRTAGCDSGGMTKIDGALIYK